MQGACLINKSQITPKSLDFVLNSIFRKIFLIKSDVVSECITFFRLSMSGAIAYSLHKRKLKFLTKLYVHSENTIGKLFEKYIIDEFDIVHEHLFS